MDQQWARLGPRIQAERARQGYDNAEDLARAAGLSRRTIEVIEAGSHTGRPRETTLRKIEHALGWAEGACEDIVMGKEPRRRVDVLTERLLTVWPTLTYEMQLTIVTVAEELARR